MGFANILLGCFLIALIVMTFITEPALSIKYFKACGKSATAIFGWIGDRIGDLMKSVSTPKTNTTNTTGETK